MNEAHPSEHAKNKVQEKQRQTEKRCESCNGLLLNHKNVEGAGIIEVKCRKCGHVNRIDVSSLTIK